MIKVILAGTSAAVVLSIGGVAAASTQVTHFADCTAMHKKYPHGVGRKGAHDHVTSGRPVTNFYVNTTLYNANKGSDRDHDGVACEAH